MLVRRKQAVARFFIALAALWCLGATKAEAHGPWVTFNDCHLLPNASNDGDSFHVRANGKEYIFRLYFVDAPETDPHLLERLQEQAKYFGITIPEALQLGDEAEKFTRMKLAQPFVVRTCMQDALGRSRLERFYALVEIGKSGDLGEALVRNGLARLHGTATKPPGMSSPEVEWTKLRQLESAAKREKIGGWGTRVGGMHKRAAEMINKGKKITDELRYWHGIFNPILHPPPSPAPSATPAVAAQPSPTPLVAGTPLPIASPPVLTTPVAAVVPPVATAKLNINTATFDQLRAAGAGPVVAGRILEARPFKTADDLHNIKGVGVKTYARLRPLFD